MTIWTWFLVAIKSDQFQILSNSCLVPLNAVKKGYIDKEVQGSPCISLWWEIAGPTIGLPEHLRTTTVHNINWDKVFHKINQKCVIVFQKWLHHTSFPYYSEENTPFLKMWTDVGCCKMCSHILERRWVGLNDLGLFPSANCNSDFEKLINLTQKRSL